MGLDYIRSAAGKPYIKREGAEPTEDSDAPRHQLEPRKPYRYSDVGAGLHA